MRDHFEDIKEIVVLGRGIAGLSIAFHLLKLNKKIYLYGKKDNRASSCAAGISSLKGKFLSKDQLFSLKVMGHFFLRNFILEINEELKKFAREPIFLKNGVSEFAKKGEGYLFLKNRVLGGSHWRGADNVYVKPKLSLEDNVELFFPNDFFFDADLLLTSLEFLCKKKGAVFLDKEIPVSTDSAKTLKLSCAEVYENPLFFFAFGAKGFYGVKGKELCSPEEPSFFSSGKTWRQRKDERGKEVFAHIENKTKFVSLPFFNKTNGEQLVDKSKNYEEICGVRLRFKSMLPKVFEFKVNLNFNDKNLNQKEFLGFSFWGFFKDGFLLAPYLSFLMGNKLRRKCVKFDHDILFDFKSLY